jgi:hypothetical protein
MNFSLTVQEKGSCSDDLRLFVYSFNTTGTVNGTGTAYLSRVPEFSPVFSGVRVARSVDACVVFCISLFAHFSFSLYSCLFLNDGVELWVRIPLRRAVLDTTLCDKVCQWLTASRWISLGTPVSSTKKA